MLIRYPLRTLLSIVVATTFVLPPILAQPPAEAPKTPNAPAPKDPAAEAQAQVQRLMKLGPADMRRAIMDMQKQQLTMFLTAAGFNDLELQETLWQFIIDQEEARTELRVAAVKLRELAADAKADETAVTKQHAIYQQAFNNEKARRTDAIRELGEVLRLETRPRLQALLALLGYIDDGVWFTGDTSSMGLMTIGTTQMAVMTTPKAAPEKVAPAAPIPPAAAQ